ncbi:hypothetical protein F4604DRAFT_1940260 [Suillus subluteus]|nr:hypothetical protein F4604DRAFT_1940260 [Suillus subluteus]
MTSTCFGAAVLKQQDDADERVISQQILGSSPPSDFSASLPDLLFIKLTGRQPHQAAVYEDSPFYAASPAPGPYSSLILSISDFCLWAPLIPNSIIGDTEQEDVARRIKAGGVAQRRSRREERLETEDGLRASYHIDGIIFSGDDYRLDDEYRYWSFAEETHPVRVSSAPSARQELDGLHRPYKDPLLAHPRPIPLPFTQDESYKLLGHLNGPISSAFSSDDSVDPLRRSQPAVNFDAYTDALPVSSFASLPGIKRTSDHASLFPATPLPCSVPNETFL